jgi:alanine racemase
MTKRVCAYIDILALQHNLQQVKKIAPQSAIMAMVKANAYGHGLLRTAQALSAADAFGVATLDEAIHLRDAGIKKPVILMSGFINATELNLAVEKQITPVIHHGDQIERLQRTRLSSPLAIWLKMDSGMGRLGFSAEQLPDIYQQLSSNPDIKKPIGLMTHLACSDQRNNPHTIHQIELFYKTVVWSGARSLACSAAIMAWPQTHADWVRPGIMLYGISPFADSTGLEFGLKPVMTLISRLIAVKEIAKGGSVGYGAAWVCDKDTKIGLVNIGYGDGYPRHAKQGTPVLVNQRRCSLVGRVSMDLIAVDLSGHPHVAVSDPVVLWGEGLPIEEVAACADTSGYELVCKVMPRVRFVEKNQMTDGN